MRGMTASFVALALAAVGFTGCQREHVVAEPDYNRQLNSGHALRKLDPSQWPSLATAWGARGGGSLPHPWEERHRHRARRAARRGRAL